MAKDLWIEILVAAVAVVAFCLAFYYWRRTRSTQRKLRYVFDATLSNDFAYRFDGTDKANATLNKIVDHLHSLTYQARKADAYYGLILDQAVTGLLVIDADDNVTHHNAAALKLLNMEVLTHLSQIERNQPSLYSALAMNLNSCVIGDRTLSLDVTSTSLENKAMRIIALNDISRPLQSKEDESWVKLTRVLTHEIMNSLTPVNSITETLLENSSEISQKSLHDSLISIASCNKSLLQFVENFRKFTIIPKPQPTAFEAQPFLQGVVTLARGLNNNINYELLVAPTDLMLYADQGMMHQVMVNLVKNAVEANPKEIKIQALLNDDESITITVENDGPLIPEEIAEHIFVPFFTTRPSGSGIGLSLSRRYATANSASLTLTRLPHTKFTIQM